MATRAYVPRSLSATFRAITSVVPPGGKPTMIFAVSSPCARTTGGSAPPNRPIAAAPRNLRRVRIRPSSGKASTFAEGLAQHLVDEVMGDLRRRSLARPVPDARPVDCPEQRQAQETAIHVRRQRQRHDQLAEALFIRLALAIET